MTTSKNVGCHQIAKAWGVTRLLKRGVIPDCSEFLEMWGLKAKAAISTPANFTGEPKKNSRWCMGFFLSSGS